MLYKTNVWKSIKKESSLLKNIRVDKTDILFLFLYQNTDVFQLHLSFHLNVFL